MSPTPTPVPGKVTDRTAVDSGRSVLVTRGRRWSFRIDVRTAVGCAVFLLLTLAVVVVTLAYGTYEIPLADVVRALFGEGPAATRTVVVEWRLPRVLLAVLLGAALAVSGAIFQSITRNPLGSPDIIGFSSGSYTGALVVMLLTGGGYYQVAAGSLAGGVLTAFVVFVLAYRRGAAQGFRLIIVGIAVSAMLGAFNTWLVLRASIEEAMLSAVWGAGSLNSLGYDQLWPVLGLLLLLVPLAAACGPALRTLELGDDAAAALGTRTEAVRLVLVVLGVALIALVTAAAGPIAFIALAAPQIARRITRGPSVALLPSAVLGAFLLALADLVGQRLFAPVQLPVGIVTVSIGGLYFIWLLVREARRT
ncbi:FecCD family ABC transporter permease [Streptomyces rhizosphaericola]|uniref:FecCD family ABC transporter permease n=1 Tax=Streptomyces TaxID=1883 RepID=UPI000490BD87|nr:iron chelate uptake ABC transporter family permease subunit [Streptomyces sp. SolWspMP-sol2th]MYT89780.1 iron chelate uptake ABC transporter family permease subunit [Streptomyces sp. SID8359]